MNLTIAKEQISNGLQEGDRVVTQGQYRLQPGDHARVLAG